ncbi:MAG: heme o synthase, partial [Candidatus Thermoplasmatota archaeon]|nr:heme o synthase [Candidatus Thermoplasmatota archaeon]
EIPLSEAFWTLIGGALAAGAAGIVNQVIERDLDAKMDRTGHRPLANGRIPVPNALAFALGLLAVAFTMQAFMVNVLAAVLTLLAVVLYVFVYTLWLKPTTPQGVVIGGAAGSMPALVGWAAVTGDLGLPALLLGLLVFLWQPPHFWALAIARKDDYEAAGFPMMPSVKGFEHTKRQMVLYTLATVLAAAALYQWTPLGMIYLVTSTVLGVLFLAATLNIRAEGGKAQARSLFTVSIAYLGMVFLAIALDRLAPLLL